MSDMHELKIAEFESARNKAVDDYFHARQTIMPRTPEREQLVMSGFRLAWELLNKAEEKRPPRRVIKRYNQAAVGRIVADFSTQDVGLTAAPSFEVGFKDGELYVDVVAD